MVALSDIKILIVMLSGTGNSFEKLFNNRLYYYKIYLQVIYYHYHWLYEILVIYKIIDQTNAKMISLRVNSFFVSIISFVSHSFLKHIL